MTVRDYFRLVQQGNDIEERISRMMAFKADNDEERFKQEYKVDGYFLEKIRLYCNSTLKIIDKKEVP